MDEPLEKRVLRAMTEGLDSTIGVAVALGKPESDIQRSVNVMMLAGLISVTPEDGKRITLTPAGQEAATAPSSLVFQSSTVVRSGDVEDIGRLISATWTMSQASQKASGKRAESRLLVTDTERESAVAALADGYATGCLSLEELNQRTGRALQARTRGELEAVTEGLGHAPTPKGRQELFASRGIFILTIAAVLSVPFVVLALLLSMRG